MQTIGILGAGAWGTALAIAAARAGRDVILQAHEPEVADAINMDRENKVYLPGITLDPAIRATTSVAEAVQTDAVLLVAPAQFLRPVLAAAKPHWKTGAPAVICAKGIEQGTYKLLGDVVGETLGDTAPVAVLSGPTFAIEVAREMPTAVTLACIEEDLGQ
ncbi:MAG TPA: NAD(P)-binding domain-containing protein, partial [Magnetovibrio sp.]